MGWRERDWARLDDEERGLLVGDGPVGRSAAEPRGRTRTLVWSGVAVIALVVAFAAYEARPAATSRTDSPNPGVVFGDLPAPNPAIAPTAPGGSSTVCTEAEAVGTAWRCDDWRILSTRERAIQAKPFGGPCAHRIVDQSTGHWICTEAASSAPDI